LLPDFFSQTSELDKQEAVGLEAKGFSRAYWLYVLAGASSLLDSLIFLNCFSF